MLRKTLTILSLIGLLLSAGLFALSYLNIAWVSTGSRYQIHIVRGQIMWLHFEFAEEPLTPSTGLQFGGFRGFKTLWRAEWTRYEREHSRIEDIVTRSRGQYSPVVYMQKIRVPFWIPALLFAILYLLLSHPILRRERKKLGLCVKCGYDPRASKSRCPECGTGFSK